MAVLALVSQTGLTAARVLLEGPINSETHFNSRDAEKSSHNVESRSVGNFTSIVNNFKYNFLTHYLHISYAIPIYTLLQFSLFVTCSHTCTVIVKCKKIRIENILNNNV